jgi:hypothetical protein
MKMTSKIKKKGQLLKVCVRFSSDLKHSFLNTLLQEKYLQRKLRGNASSIVRDVTKATRNTHLHNENTFSVGYIISTEVGTNFADKQRSLGQYNSLADSGHRFWFYLYTISKINKQEFLHCT